MFHTVLRETLAGNKKPCGWKSTWGLLQNFEVRVIILPLIVVLCHGDVQGRVQRGTCSK